MDEKDKKDEKETTDKRKQSRANDGWNGATINLLQVNRAWPDETSRFVANKSSKRGKTFQGKDKANIAMDEIIG